MNKTGASPFRTTLVLRWFVGTVLFVMVVYGALAGVFLIASHQQDEGAPFSSTNKKQAEEAPYDLSDWTDEELAAQILIVMNPSRDFAGIGILASRGVGAIVLAGNNPPEDIGAVIKEAQEMTPRDIKMFFASDEEGGEIFRMQALLGSFPSAEEMGTWNPQKISDTTFEYGKKLSELGINMVIAPAADLEVPETYMTEYKRAFSADPQTVARCVVAWQDGMRGAGIVVCPKHWPGMGHAGDTHKATATVPALTTLEKEDMVPFRALFSVGVDAVMVGHVSSDGLTEPNTPATISPQALSYLRASIDEDTLIVTDTMSMAGVQEAVHLTPEEAMVRSLIAGADFVMIGASRTDSSIATIARAMKDGRLSRARVERSVYRILRLKARIGLIPQENEQ